MSDIKLLKGVGPKTHDNLAQLGIDSVEDLLFHLPLRYEDRTRISDIKTLLARGSSTAHIGRGA
ncbi:MAG: hypothetical protein HOH86_12420 [Verrucomicrobiales bacterium]|nr:hypothetical protein [Verrucomicrobiales bacterium]